MKTLESFVDGVQDFLEDNYPWTLVPKGKREGVSMTDRYIAFTVALDRQTRDDEAAFVANAIRMIRGVASVAPVVADANTYWAKETARLELAEKVYEVLKPKRD